MPRGGIKSQWSIVEQLIASAFGSIADMARLAVGSTRSRMTQADITPLDPCRKLHTIGSSCRGLDWP